MCIYFARANGTSGAVGFSANTTGSNLPGDGSPYGFIVDIDGAANFTANGTWAYTAP